MVCLPVSVHFCPLSLWVASLTGLFGTQCIFGPNCLGPNSGQEPLASLHFPRRGWPHCCSHCIGPMQDATALNFLQSHPRENACKLPAGRAKWGFWLPGVQISTLDSLALLPLMSRPAYSFFMGPQPYQSCTRQSATNKATGALGGLQLIRRCFQPWNVS